MHTIFLIGATGKVGGAAARHLAQFEDIRVIAGLRCPEDTKGALPDTIERRYFDLDAVETMALALRGVDAVLLLTGYTVDMMKQSKRVIDSAVAEGVRHIVHIGASSNSTTEVAHWGWHRMIEAYIAASGLSYTNLHPEAYMQNLTAFGWFDGRNLTNLIGDCRWSWVDAEDVGLLAAEALRRPEDFAGQSWGLGYDTGTMRDVAELLTAHTGESVTLQSLDPKDFYDAAVAAGGDPAYLACIRDQFQMNAAGEISDADATFDASAFYQATGRKPRMWDDYLNAAFAAKDKAA
ncbi:MAG: NmrA family NAD(P)-binding protein [Pseudomonadota bacterium]